MMYWNEVTVSVMQALSFATFAGTKQARSVVSQSRGTNRSIRYFSTDNYEKINKKRVHFLSGGTSPCPMKHVWKRSSREKIIAKIHSNRFSIYLFINKKNMHWTCCYNIDSAELYGSLLYDLISNKYVSRYKTEPQKNLFTILFIF